jgi:anthranilate phosphoribosyltransferase
MSPEPALHAAASAPYAEAIRRLGRNARPDGAGVLDEELAGQVWNALLDERFSPAQEAALLMGLRVHGESAAMLAAFARATQPRLPALAGPPTIVLHCAGQARRQASLAPLVALALAESGTRVLLSTPADTGRGNSAGVLRALGLRPGASADEVAAQLATRRLAWWPLAAWAPPLARLAGLRASLGFRNTSHSLVKLVSPLAQGVVAMNYTHGAYRASLAEAATRLGLNAWLARGTEGDPVLWETEAHAPLALLRGAPLPLPGQPPAEREATALIAGDDAGTARYTRAVLAGSAPWPAALTHQVRQLRALAQAAHTLEAAA